MFECGWPFLLGVRAGPPFSGPSVFITLVVGPSFLGLGFGLSLFECGWPCLHGVRVLAFPSRGESWPSSGPSVFLMLVVGPSFLGLGLAFPCWSGVGPSLLGCGGWPCLLGVWWLALPLSGLGLACPSSGGNWSCLFGVGVVPSFLGLGFGPSFLGCGGWPCLLVVRVFAFPSRGEGWQSLLGPVRLSHAFGWPFLLRVGVGLSLFEWGWPFLLGVRVGPPFLGCGGRPFLLGVRTGPPFSGPSVFLTLVVGPSFLGLRLAFPCSSGVGPSFLAFGGWPCLLGICWPTTLGVQVGLSCFGWELVLSLWCGGCPFLLEVRPGPPFSGPSVFLMLVVGPS